MAKKVVEKKEEKGLRVCEVIRHAAAEGLDTSQTKALLDALDIEYSPTTVSIQRSKIITGQVDPPEFDKSKLAQIARAWPKSTKKGKAAVEEPKKAKKVKKTKKTKKD